MHDEMASNKGPSSGVKQMKPAAEGSDGQTHQPGPTETPIEDHVMEHGPAHTVHYHHDEDGDGMHHVSSYHGEAKPLDGMGGGEHPGGAEGKAHPGHHHSVHKSAEAAHEHAGKAMGMDHEDMAENEGDETPDSMQDQEAGARKIPGLA